MMSDTNYLSHQNKFLPSINKQRQSSVQESERKVKREFDVRRQSDRDVQLAYQDNDYRMMMLSTYDGVNSLSQPPSINDNLSAG